MPRIRFFNLNPVHLMNAYRPQYFNSLLILSLVLLVGPWGVGAESLESQLRSSQRVLHWFQHPPQELAQKAKWLSEWLEKENPCGKFSDQKIHRNQKIKIPREVLDALRLLYSERCGFKGSGRGIEAQKVHDSQVIFQ